MYLGQTQRRTPAAVGGGETKTIRSQRGERPRCPSGWQEISRHGFGMRSSVECYAPPRAAPRPEAPRITVTVPTRTTVSPAIQAQISPQVSPTLAQQQASPGAGVAAQPAQVMPGGLTARTGREGITGEQLQRILEAERAAARAEAEAQARKSAAESAELARQMRERQRQTEQIAAAEAQAQREAEAQRQAAAARAEAQARAAPAALPPPPSMMPTPFAPPMPVTPPPPPPAEMRAETTVVEPRAEVREGLDPMMLAIIAAVGIGAIALMGGAGKRRKRKR